MLAAAVLMLFGACKQKTEAPVEQPQDNIYQFTVLDGAGNPVSLADYGGQVLLVVNTATQCGFTPQYEELQKLYDLYRDKGFVISTSPATSSASRPPAPTKRYMSSAPAPTTSPSRRWPRSTSTVPTSSRVPSMHGS